MNSTPLPGRIAGRVGRLRVGIDGLRGTLGGRDRMYIGWLGYANVGDEWVWHLICDVIPNFSVAAEDLPLLSWQAALARANARGAGFIAVGGGTLIGTERVGEQLTRIKSRHPDASVAFLGSGVEDRPLSTTWIAHLEASNAVFVRGPQSQARLARSGVHSEVLGDPGFLLTPDDQLSRVDGTRMTLNVAAALERTADGEHELRSLVDGAGRLQPRFDRTDILVLSPEDLRISRRLQQELPHRATLSPIYRLMRPSARAFVADLAIGVRLHFGVFSAAVGTPTVMVAYHSKARDIESLLEVELVLPARFSAQHLIDASNTAIGARSKLMDRAGYLRTSIRSGLSQFA